MTNFTRTFALLVSLTFKIVIGIGMFTNNVGCATTGSTSTECKPGEVYSFSLERCVPERSEQVPEYLTPPKFSSSKPELPYRRMRTINVVGTYTSSAGTADSDLKKQIKSPVWLAGGTKRDKRPTAVASKR